MSSPSSADLERPTGGQPTRVAVLGSTGSIGRQALDVIGRDPAFRIVALAAGANAGLLAEQVREHRPAVAAIDNPGRLAELRGHVPTGTETVAGPEALLEIAAREDVDLLVVAT